MSTQRIYRLLSWWNDARAASKGPTAYGRRVVRRESHKRLARILRKVL